MKHLKVCAGVSFLGATMLLASAGQSVVSAAPAVPGQYGGNQNYNRRGLSACEKRLSDKIHREKDNSGRVRTDRNTIEESRESDSTNRIRGKGQYDSRDGVRTFSFSCKYSVNDGRVIDIDYSTDSGNGGYGGNDDQYYDNNARIMTDYPRVRVDTDGRGNFQSQRIGNGNISRGYVDVRSSRPTVGFTGPRGFKILLYGDVLQSDGRSMLIRINDSSRGRVRGRAQVQLNNDRNEVESITVQGRDFSGNFNRNN